MGNKAALITLLAGIVLILIPTGVAKAFSGAGSGTEEYPYIITNVYQLQEILQDPTLTMLHQKNHQANFRIEQLLYIQTSHQD